jgi:hypothetical protein
MTTQTWNTCLGRLAPTPAVLAELDRLRAALPGYDVIVTRCGPTYRYEATHRPDGPGPWCVISTDPTDLRRELGPWAHTPGPAARAP